MSSVVNQTALNSFNKNHSNYDAFRPSFPSKVVDPFLASLGLAEKNNLGVFEFKTEKKILELAAGTGKFTKNLIENGWAENVVVVEPSEGMLKSFKVNFPGVKALPGSSYEIPLQSNSVDSVIAAQAFHWFSDEQSLKEIRRVLKPNGTLGLIWNADVPSVSQKVNRPFPKIEFLFENVCGDIVIQFEDLIKSKPMSEDKPLEIFHEFASKHPWAQITGNAMYAYDIQLPQYRQGNWRQVLCEDHQYFSPIQRELFLFYNGFIQEDATFKAWSTRSYITALSEQERKGVEHKFTDLLKSSVTESDKFVKDGETYLIKPTLSHAVVLKCK